MTTPFIFTIYSAGYLVSALVAMSTAWVAWNSRHRSGAKELAVLMVAATFWAFCGIFETAALESSTKISWSKLEYIGAVTTPVFYFIFVMVFTGRDRKFKFLNRLWLFIIPAITLFFAFANERFHFLWSGFSSISPVTNLMAYYHGPWFWIGYMGYSYLLLIIATLFLLLMSLNQARIFRAQTTIIFLAGLFPWLSSLLYLSQYNPIPDYDLTRVTFILSGSIIALARYNYRLFDLVPVAREALIESMKDGILVIDGKNSIQDINPAASRFLGLSKSDVVGMTLDEIPAQNTELLRTITMVHPDHPQVLTFPEKEIIIEVNIQPIIKRPDSRQVILRDI
ncbi:MAG: histidine kinase N-terminal 7TM domain-containing protein, partial [bacterium]